MARRHLKLGSVSVLLLCIYFKMLSISYLALHYILSLFIWTLFFFFFFLFFFLIECKLSNISWLFFFICSKWIRHMSKWRCWNLIKESESSHLYSALKYCIYNWATSWETLFYCHMRTTKTQISAFVVRCQIVQYLYLRNTKFQVFSWLL